MMLMLPNVLLLLTFCFCYCVAVAAAVVVAVAALHLILLESRSRFLRYILGSPGFSSLPLRLARSILERRTLSAREVDAFEAAVRWTQAELQRRVGDGCEGAVPSTAQIFGESFGGAVDFSALSSEVGKNGRKNATLQNSESLFMRGYACSQIPNLLVTMSSTVHSTLNFCKAIHTAQTLG